MAQEQVVIRKYDPETDAPFVYDSMLKYYFDKSSGFTKGLSKSTFHKRHRAIMGAKLAHHDTIALVATMNESILGYLIATPDVLHWTYVKFPYRRKGICRMLLIAAGILDLNKVVYTHRTKDLEQMKFDVRYPGAIYDPYLIGC
jgi:hypothetical protein